MAPIRSGTARLPGLWISIHTEGSALRAGGEGEVWAFNAPTLRRKQLLRLRRTEVWMSRQRLLERYGDRQDRREGDR